MALCAVKFQSELEEGYVLAPERYDPRRDALRRKADAESVPLRAIAVSLRRVVDRKTAGDGKWLVLDTSDAQEGTVICRKDSIEGSEIGSAKKLVEKHTVIISRLRPYLRQVAYADEGIGCWDKGVLLACSTEFFVLRSTDNQSIAFLVPFLLCDPVQKVLAASQEGGHHPRFAESALLSLPVPKRLLQDRGRISEEVVKGVRMYREMELRMVRMVAEAGKSLQTLER
jgi:hypothetical protein